MDYRYRVPLVLVVAGLTVIGSGGCSGHRSGLLGFGLTGPNWWGSRAGETGTISPAERMERLRSLANKAFWSDADTKQRISTELAATLRAEEDPLIRAEIIRTLAKYTGSEADEVLRGSLGDPDSDVRIAACQYWAERGTEEATTHLAAVLGGDVDPDVRLAAVKALGHSKSPAAVTHLGTALEDKDPAMQYQAVRSLEQITGKNLGTDVNRWRQYVRGDRAAPVSVAEQFRRAFRR